MAKKKLSPIEHLSLIIKSKRGAVIALIGALATVETTNPGTFSSLLGEQWATKIMGVLAVLVALTKAIDNNKAE